jgi:hypothetical protein
MRQYMMSVSAIVDQLTLLSHHPSTAAATGSNLKDEKNNQPWTQTSEEERQVRKQGERRSTED